jgi:hypothetical protein
MIVELLTPLVIATAPIRIDVPEIAYNHETQVSVTVAKADIAGLTGAGTRTYDGFGQPFDADND